MNSCLSCGQAVKNKFCNVSCQNTFTYKGVKKSKESIEKRRNTNSVKWKNFIVKCAKCNCEFEIKEYNVENPKKEKYYCSRSCANTRIKTQETKDKISNAIKKSEKFFNSIKDRKITKTNYQRSKKINKTICLYCNEEIIIKNYKKNRKYHNECWRKISGGYRKGSSRGKSGWYKGYWCDSSYELAYVIYALDHKIKFKRNTKGFRYTYKNKEHLYYPDFVLSNNSYIEIKNFKSEITNAKLKYFPHEIIIYYKQEMKFYIDYAVNKHGKKYIDLYEKQ